MITNKTYRVGIVGLSPIATGVHLKPDSSPPLERQLLTSHATSLALMPQFEVVGVCDLVPELLEKFEQRWGRQWPNASPYEDYKEMISKENLDVLSVVTSDHRHTSITVDGANAGIKGIFVEKPLATSLEDADSMIDACEQNGVALSVDHTRRWNPLYHKVRDTILSGTIGQLGTIVATQGGKRAMLFRNGTHMIDLICFFANSEPEQAFCLLEKGFEEWDRYRGDGGKLPENDPGASAMVKFQNGVRAFYCGTKNTYQMFSIQLSGTEGQIYVNDESAHLVTGGPDKSERRKQLILPGQYQVQGLVAAYQELIDMIENGSTGVSSGIEARKTVRIMMGFLKSQQEESSLVNVPA